MIYILSSPFSNFRSVEAACIHLGFSTTTVSPLEVLTIEYGSVLIVPGVGNMQSFSSFITDSILLDVFRDFLISHKIKILSICLGFHFLFSCSYESALSPCLSLFESDVIPIFNPLRPSVGWFSSNSSEIIDTSYFNERLTGYLAQTFYFTHSYGVAYDDKVAKRYNCFYYITDSGSKFLSAIYNSNYIGFQFHPEKSGAAGLSLLQYTLEHLEGTDDFAQAV